MIYVLACDDVEVSLTRPTCLEGLLLPHVGFKELPSFHRIPLKRHIRGHPGEEEVLKPPDEVLVVRSSRFKAPP